MLVSLFQIDRLNYIAREKELGRPIHQHADFALDAGQLAQIDSAPHGPREEPRKTHGFAPHKGHGQFRASCLMPHDAERAEGIEVESFERPTFELGLNVASEPDGFAQRKLRGRWAGL